MQSTRDIQRKIRTVRNIQQICRAMKTVSSIKLRKAEERIRGAQPYADALRQMVSNLGHAELAHPLLEAREVRRSAVVVISADKGLAGSYNANIIREAAALMRQLDDAQAITLGRRVSDTFRRMSFPVDMSLNPLGTPEFRTIAALADHIGAQYTGRVWDRVYLVYQRFGGRVVTEQLLPIEPLAADEGAADFIFEPDPAAILEQLLPRYLRTLLFTAVLAASASEHAARVAAMSLATENADELIDSLTLEYNKSRQANITRELTDIVGATEALT